MMMPCDLWSVGFISSHLSDGIHVDGCENDQKICAFNNGKLASCLLKEGYTQIPVPMKRLFDSTDLAVNPCLVDAFYAFFTRGQEDCSLISG